MNYKGKIIIACPSCSGRMRVPVSDAPLRVKCPLCGEQFRHDPDPYFAQQASRTEFSAEKIWGRIKAGTADAANRFAHWSPGKKLMLYIAILALVMTFISGRGAGFPAGTSVAVPPQSSVSGGKVYLLEDPAFVALLAQRARTQIPGRDSFGS